MSRYLLLFFLNLPFILAGILSLVTQYKLGHSTKKRFVTQLLLWLVILIGLLAAEPLYIWLFSNGLTRTDSLSLFDVIQITAIVAVWYIVNRSRLKIGVLEHRIKELHQEISIQLSSNK